ncbi:hypothetical protein [Paludisphaera mucosa]|uniref:Uncharacterized protein n=1 Tax=Paludisphaera mucosa TaxID=3030827 RepID=A0ABT6F7T3_9BACT|nr:hypothetical protein [Paludisphaera mucosa]MDG3003620.1 hypothetical protein [Paludisphaera mucosa]
MRSVETCPHHDDDAEGGPACRLVAEVLGAGAAAAGPVGPTPAVPAAGPTPDARRPGPVVASLVARAAEVVHRAGGLPGCDAAKAAEVKRWALKYLVAAGPDVDRAYRPPRLTQACHFLGEKLGPPSERGRTPPAGDAIRSCRHPSHRTTTIDGCMLCRDWTDRPRPAPRPLDVLLKTPDRQGPLVRQWAVGVTTSPRGAQTLDWTLDSLARAGWDDVRVFEDLPTTIAPRHAGRPTTTRIPTVGAWPSYYLGLAELIMRHPEADAYFMLQDDVLLYDRQDLREYLETMLWPSDPPGLISLYCSSVYTRPGAAWHELEEAWVWGALAFIFPRDLARRFVADPWVLAHRWSASGHGLVAIDVLIGAWADRHRFPVHFPCPSLAQHIGAVSTLWGSHTLDERRMADRFLGDLEPG